MSGRVRRLVLLLLLCLAAAAPLIAQGPSDANEGSRLEWDNANQIWRFSWWGRTGQTYFVQHSDDLATWTYVPMIEPGNNAIREWGFTSDGEKFVLRLKHTNEPTSNPSTADFDRDGISNMDELLQSTDPLHSADDDGDGMPNDWELHFELNPSGNDANLDLDGDGLTNGEEASLGTDPRYAQPVPPRYAIIDLMNGIEAASGFGVDLNNSGEALLGIWSDNKSALQYIRRTKGNIELLDVGLYDRDLTELYGINDNGAVVGTYTEGYPGSDTNLSYPAIWPRGSTAAFRLPLPEMRGPNGEGINHGNAFAISRVGTNDVVYGVVYPETDDYSVPGYGQETHRWSTASSQPGQIETLGIRATADGDSLCGSKILQGQTVYFAGSPDRLIDFHPWGVNSIGDAVGIIPGQATGALACEDGRFDFPDTSLNGINAKREFVGSIWNVSSPGPAFWLWDWEKTKAVRYPLNRWIALPNPTAQWPIFTYAEKINNSGMILTSGFQPGGNYERPYLLLPVELVEVTPTLKDEAGAEIPNSTKPKYLPQINDLVEEPRTGQTPNVAYRVLKVKVPKEMMAGEKVKWSMTPQFTPQGATEPRFRGVWPAAPHADRFEAAPGNAYGFQRISQAEGRTTVDAEGFFAVRINLPPIGFNKARVKLEFEKYPGALVQVDFQVPAIVVIDPGHGGTGRITDPDGGYSDGEHAVGPLSHVQEKAMALTYGLALRDALKTAASNQRLSIKVFMTRETDVNFGPRFRTNKARDNGADILLSIHFNAFNATARGVGNLDSAAYGKCKL